MRPNRTNNKKNFQYVFIAIEIAWLVMGAFTTFAGIKIIRENHNNSWLAWLFFVVALLCFLMFFGRRNYRKKSKVKRKK